MVNASKIDKAAKECRLFKEVRAEYFSSNARSIPLHPVCLRSYKVSMLLHAYPCKPQAVLFGCRGLGKWDSCGGVGGGGGGMPYTLIQVKLGLVSLYVMLLLTPTPPTSHLPNNTACDANNKGD